MEQKEKTPMLFAVNAVNPKFGWARDPATGGSKAITLKSYKAKRKAKNRVAAASKRRNRT